MTFFDKKTEVFDIELTPYGKHLLSLGKFKPYYYEFFDDDIIYDSQYAGFDERQEEIQERIKDTPRTRTQYVFSGRETEIKKNIELVRSGREKNEFSDKFLPVPEKHYSLTSPLGKSDISSNKNPSWSIKFLKGTLKQTQKNVSNEYPSISIPRILTDSVKFETYPAKDNTNEQPNEFSDSRRWWSI